MTIQLNNRNEVDTFYKILKNYWMYMQHMSEYTVGVGNIDKKQFPEGKMADDLMRFIEENNDIELDRLPWPVPLEVKKHTPQ